MNVCRAVPSSRPDVTPQQKEEVPSRRPLPARPVSAARAVPARAVPVPGLTNALNAIGISVLTDQFTVDALCYSSMVV